MADAGPPGYWMAMPDAAVSAATLVLLRDRAGLPPELLMVERSTSLAFAPGALVFPGGRVEPGDHALAAAHGIAGEDGAARVAAIRETVEEAGLPAGLDSPPGSGPSLRAALAGGMPFADALATAGAALRPERLVPFARWRPPHDARRVFDTRFFLARAPAEAVPPVPDGAETTRAFWVGAADLLERARAGTAAMIFPTRRTIERLARYRSADEAFADAADRPIRLIEPWIEQRDGEPHLCIPEDMGYPVTAERLADTRRG